MREESIEGGALPAETSIGRVSIGVDDLERLVPFYRDAVGCRVDRAGSIARLRAADGRELVVLDEEPGLPPRPRAAAGLFHVAIRLPDRGSLSDALARLRAAGADLTGASDHLVSEALYLRDPAGNGVELYRDRPRESWTRLGGGRVEMDSLPLDLEDLLAAGEGAAREGLPPGTDVGHVHLEVTDLATAKHFYGAVVGFGTSSEYRSEACFLAAGGYHHHVGLNTWNGRSAPSGDHQGLEWFEVVLPDDDARGAVLNRLAGAGYDVDRSGEVPTVSDPDGIEVMFPVRTGEE